MHIPNKSHLTPLHLASLYGRLDIARVLLDNGATANPEDKFGRTPLHLVVDGKYHFERDRLRFAQLLLEHGADTNAQDEDDATPLHLASYDGRIEIVRVLLDHGAAANSKDNQDRTALHSVAEGRYHYSKDHDGIRVAQLLLERGADVNAPDKDNGTPLHLASCYGRIEIARVLLDGGAATNSKGNRGRSPLHVVAEGGNFYSRDTDAPAAQLLLERGADVNALDDDDQTPLHLASYFVRAEMVLVLLKAGANASAKNAQGQTPLHLMSKCLYEAHVANDVVGVAQLLLDHGSDVNAQDKNHATPSDLASYHRRMNLASLLLRYGASDDANAARADQRLTPPTSGDVIIGGRATSR
jgi:cytohesin